MPNKTIEDAHALLDKFHDSASVGRLIFHKSPQKTYIVWHEATVKAKELSEEEVSFLERFSAEWDALKIEIEGRDGCPVDRVRVTRLFT